MHRHLQEHAPDTPSERASFQRQDIARNAHNAHNAHSTKPQVSGACDANRAQDQCALWALWTLRATFRRTHMALRAAKPTCRKGLAV